MSSCRVYEKKGDWKGTTRMKQDVQLSFHNGFRDDENTLEIEDDICYFFLKLYLCNDYTGKRAEKYIASTLLSLKGMNTLIDALIRARDHHLKQKALWEKNGKKWESSDGGDEPGPCEEQNRIYMLPWEGVSKKYGV